MTPRPKALFPKSAIITLRVSDEMFAHLRGVQDRDGVPISEQVRRGIRLWLKSMGVLQTERKRANTRRRS
jgi:hypothetical protein